MVQHAGLNVEL